MNDAPELAVCPFCGEDGGQYFNAGHRVNCICQDPSTTDVSRAEGRAVGAALWNGRADLAPAWQPIATAPINRDGIWAYDQDNEWQCEVWWDGDKWTCPHWPVWPTHWMPLPTSPEGAA